MDAVMTVYSSAMSLSEDHLVIKTLFNGLAWVEIKTHDLIHTTPGWAVGPALEQQLTPIQFLGVDEVATGTDTGQIFIFKIHGNKPISTLDLHGGKRDLLANTWCLMNFNKFSSAPGPGKYHSPALPQNFIQFYRHSNPMDPSSLSGLVTNPVPSCGGSTESMTR